jgi:DNA repair ATPase RecN
MTEYHEWYLKFGERDNALFAKKYHAILHEQANLKDGSEDQMNSIFEKYANIREEIAIRNKIMEEYINRLERLKDFLNKVDADAAEPDDIPELVERTPEIFKKVKINGVVVVANGKRLDE